MARRRRIVIAVAVAAVQTAAVCALVASGTGLAAGAPPAATAGQVPVGVNAVALNQPADPFLGKITPSQDADVAGMYSAQAAWPLIGIHMVLLPNGHVVSYGSPVGAAQQGGLAYDDWDPALGTGPGAHRQSPSMHSYNSFCNSLQRLPDGRLLMVGGNSSASTMIYDPATGEQTMGANVARQRWYASVLRLPDDRMLVLGGGNTYNFNAYQNPADNSGVATVPEIGNGAGPWTQLTGADSTLAFGAQDNRWWYPRAYVGPDGSVFGVSFDRMWRLNPAGSGSVVGLGTLPTPIGVSGGSVMYAPGKILLAGGGQHTNETAEVATNAATVVDINAAAPVVTSTTPMRYGRNWATLTVLPTGEVLTNGGTKVGTQAGDANQVRQAEIWNPDTGNWRPAATAKRTRTYHSTSVLLPGGSVLTAAGGVPGPEDNFNAEVFYPSYLFAKGSDGVVRWADRPRIQSISGSLRYGGSVNLGIGGNRPLSSMSLISAAAVTHSYNTDQRRVPLSFTQNGGTVTATMPANANLAPPGTYLLSGVDTAGVPTPAQLVTINADGSAGTVSVYDKDQASSANVALGAATSQSSTEWGGVPGRAVDGNTDGEYNHNSVTHTAVEPQPWWAVDLGTQQPVTDVVIRNRTDCCRTRLSNFFVLASDKPFTGRDPASVRAEAGVSSYYVSGVSAPSVTIAVNRSLRYLRIQLAGTDALSLAEVQVRTAPPGRTPENRAATGTVSQSSTAYGAGPALAVDGVTDGLFSHNSVTHTNADKQAWWAVDLGSTASLGSVVITNRADCCTDRLGDFVLLASDQPIAADLDTARTQAGVAAYPVTDRGAASYTVAVDRAARYLRIQLTGTQNLSLAEVEVRTTDLAFHAVAAQPSIVAGGDPARAVDGNTDGDYRHSSVSHTDNQAQPSWTVDLGSSHPVGEVVIWNRTDCCADRLANFSLLASDTPFGAADLAGARSQPGVTWSDVGAVSGPSVTVPVNRTARYLRVQLTGSGFLSLAEVQVFAPGTR